MPEAAARMLVVVAVLAVADLGAAAPVAVVVVLEGRAGGRWVESSVPNAQHSATT